MRYHVKHFTVATALLVIFAIFPVNLALAQAIDSATTNVRTMRPDDQNVDPQAQTTILSLLFHDELVAGSEINMLDEISRVAPASFVITSAGESVVIESGTNKVRWYSEKGVKLNEFDVPGAAGLTDIELISDEIYVLDTFTGEPVVYHLAETGKQIERIPVYRGMARSGLTGILLKGEAENATSTQASNPSDSYPYRSTCPGVASQTDPWSFYKCECVSYAAWKLNQRGIPFNNTYRMPSGKRWSNASNWKVAAGLARISMDMNPKVGDIAWFTYGHVAYVESVTKSGSTVTSIVVSEYNYNINTAPHTFGFRTFTAQQFATKSIGGFIHF